MDLFHNVDGKDTCSGQLFHLPNEKSQCLQAILEANNQRCVANQAEIRYVDDTYHPSHRQHSVPDECTKVSST